MIFEETVLPGAFVITRERLEDERGFFARTYDREIYSEHGLATEIDQCSISFNRAPARSEECTTSVLHKRQEPMGEPLGDIQYRSVLRRQLDADMPEVCGGSGDKIDDHVVRGSTRAADQLRLFERSGLGDGLPNLDTVLARAFQGIRWNDPVLGVAWPADVRVISERDRTFPDLEP